MPKKNEQKPLCVEALRHSEYYGMQETFDALYAESAAGEKFINLMDLILSRENILLAYRNIKANDGSDTPGTDNLTIKDIGRLTPEDVVERVRSIINGKWGYRPRPVRRKEIPKPNGTMRPLGIPCIWDRLIQQCIKQIMEPICEAKFSNNSYGFRPMRSVENAISATYNRLQHSNLHYVIEFDIKGFFDEVNHSKLVKQIWAMGIQDKYLLYVLKQILKAPIRMPDNSTICPTKGTPQGGIISPLLANIVLNELDRWIESQWEYNPHVAIHSRPVMQKDGSLNKSNGYRWMRQNTTLKEMYIVRYADDFRIFCRTKTDAEKTLIAVTQWLQKRLRLQVSPEKTRVVNVKRRYSEFLGFKIKVHKKSGKYVVKSHIADKSLKRIKKDLTNQAKNVAKPRTTEVKEINRYNSMVEGMQNYYNVATHVNLDCSTLNRVVMTIFTNRLQTQAGPRLIRKGRELTKHEKERYGKSAMLRYVAGSDEPIYPIGYIQHKNPMAKKRSVNPYSAEGRNGIHDNLRVNTTLMWRMMKQPLYDRSAEYADNRISLFSAQWGKCAITGIEFTSLDSIHCHHIIPRDKGGTDKYQNLVLILLPVHTLIHATQESTIAYYLKILNLSEKQLAKVNEYREKAGYAKI